MDYPRRDNFPFKTICCRWNPLKSLPIMLTDFFYLCGFCALSKICCGSVAQTRFPFFHFLLSLCESVWCICWLWCFKMLLLIVIFRKRAADYNCWSCFVLRFILLLLMMRQKQIPSRSQHLRHYCACVSSFLWRTGCEFIWSVCCFVEEISKKEIRHSFPLSTSTRPIYAPHKRKPLVFQKKSSISIPEVYILCILTLFIRCVWCAAKNALQNNCVCLMVSSIVGWFLP